MDDTLVESSARGGRVMPGRRVAPAGRRGESGTPVAQAASPTSPGPRSLARGLAPARQAASAIDGRRVCWLLVVFLILEYARPPLIVLLRLQLLIILVLPLLWARSRERPWDPILTAQVLLLALLAQGVFTATNNYAAYFTTRTMFGNVVIAVASTWLVADFRNLRLLVWTWVAVMSYCAVYALTHGGVGPGGFIGDENDLALGCTTALPFAFFGFEWLRGWRRWLCLGLAILLISAIIASFSRGGFVGLVGAAAYCFYASRHKWRLLAAGLVAALAFVLLAPPTYMDEIRTIRDTREGTALTRRYLWTTAYRMWRANPILGVGGGNFNFRAGEYQPRTGDWTRDLLERSWSGTTVHSLYFQVLAELGLAGVLLYLLVVGRHFYLLGRLRAAMRRDPRAPPDLVREVELYSSGLTSAMVGFLVAGAFLSVAYYPYPWYLSGIAVGLRAGARRRLARVRASEEAPPACVGGSST